MPVAQHQLASRPSEARIFSLVLGYLIAFGAAMSLLSVPLYDTFLLFAAGAVVIWFAHCATPPVTTWRSWSVLIGGCVLLIGVLSLFGQERIRHWTPHPAGYIPAWFILFSAIRHFWYLLVHNEARPTHNRLTSQ
jgi:hypothetical protein